MYDICVRTADAGGDARGRVDDALFGDIWAGPYLALEPDLAFVVELPDDEPRPDDAAPAAVVGYLVATADTAAFVERYRREWMPAFTRRHARTPDSEPGYTPERMLIPELDSHPAHLHLDLLPRAQGRGFGRALLRTGLAALAARGAPAVHLGVDPRNTGALAFYDRLGFAPLPSSRPEAPLLGIRTDAAV